MIRRPNPQTSVLAFLAILATLPLAGNAVLNGDDVAAEALPEVFSIKATLTSEGAPSEISCSGTLIHPRIVLTAAHCLTGQLRVDYLVNGPSSRGLNAKIIELGLTPASAGRVALAEKSAPFPKFGRYSHNEYSTSTDVGYILLKEPVLDVEPARIFLADTEEKRKSVAKKTAFIAGYGASSDETLEALYLTQGTKRQGQLPITSVRSQAFNARNDGQFPLEGDSGGPVFIERDGERFLLGTISGEKSGNTARTANFTLITREKLCWIEKHSGVDLPEELCKVAK